MSIKKLSILPNINEVRAIGTNPFPISERITSNDLMEMSISGTPGDSGQGVSFSPEGWASVRVPFAVISDKISNDLSISDINSRISALAGVSANIASNSASISTITGTTIPTNIAASISAIAAVSAGMLSNINALAGVSANIATNTASINLLSEEVDAVALDVSQLAGISGSVLADIEYLKSGYIEEDGIFEEYNADGYESTVVSAQIWNNSIGEDYATSGVALATGEFLKITVNPNTESAEIRYLPLYIFSTDHPSGG